MKVSHDKVFMHKPSMPLWMGRALHMEAVQQPALLLGRDEVDEVGRDEQIVNLFEVPLRVRPDVSKGLSNGAADGRCGRSQKGRRLWCGQERAQDQLGDVRPSQARVPVANVCDKRHDLVGVKEADDRAEGSDGCGDRGLSGDERREEAVEAMGLGQLHGDDGCICIVVRYQQVGKALLAGNGSVARAQSGSKLLCRRIPPHLDDTGGVSSKEAISIAEGQEGPHAVTVGVDGGEALS